MTATIELRRLDGSGSHELVPQRLLVAGFTGRDAEAVRAHVEELRDFGAPVPDEVPTLMRLDPGLVTTDDEILVGGGFTSGEIEAVLAVAGEDLLLLAGSDHTDRDVERDSIERSKQVCPKVLGTDCVGLDAVSDWDAVELASWVDGEADAYQRGTLGELLPLADLTAFLGDRGVTLQDGDVVYLGTVPVRGGLRPAERFRGLVRVPGTGAELEVSYSIRVDPASETV